MLDCRNKELEVWRKRQQLQKDAEDVKRACKDADMELTKAKAQSNLLSKLFLYILSYSLKYFHLY